jgi:hypothetical protein
MAAERAGAEAVLVLNSVPDGEPSGGLMEMGDDGGRVQPSIPAVMVAQVGRLSTHALTPALTTLSLTRTLTLDPDSNPKAHPYKPTPNLDSKCPGPGPEKGRVAMCSVLHLTGRTVNSRDDCVPTYSTAGVGCGHPAARGGRGSLRRRFDHHHQPRAGVRPALGRRAC